jgi:hypothetical protein
MFGNTTLVSIVYCLRSTRRGKIICMLEHYCTFLVTSSLQIRHSIHSTFSCSGNYSIVRLALRIFDRHQRNNVSFMLKAIRNGVVQLDRK